MSNSANLCLPYLVSAQAQKEVTHNDALNIMDFLAQPRVKDHSLNAPPASPAEGDAYIVGASPTGAWAGKAGNLAAYYSGWIFSAPKTGWTAWSDNGGKILYFDGSAWGGIAHPSVDATATWNPGVVANGAGVASSAIAVSGAEFGDVVLVSAPYDLQGAIACAYVSSAENVTIRLQNGTGGSLTFASGTWRVRVGKA